MFYAMFSKYSILNNFIFIFFYTKIGFLLFRLWKYEENTILCRF